MAQMSALIPIKSKIKDKNHLSIFEIILKDKERVTIGRESESDLILDSVEISRKHAFLKYCHFDRNWSVCDLESTNGLFVNDIRLMPFTPHCLQDGDQLSFGPSNHSDFVYKFVANYCSKYNYLFNINNDLYSMANKEAEELNKCLVKESIVSSKRKDKETKDGKSGSAYEELTNKTKRGRIDPIDELLDESFDSELSCPICAELFVEAVTLNCCHTFCLTCIENWKRQLIGSTGDCPKCRQPIHNQNKCLVLDNIIENLVIRMSPEDRDHRRRLIDERNAFKLQYLSNI